MAKPTRRQRKTEEVLAALLRGHTVKQAAAEVGMGYRTLRSWLASDWFRAEYAAIKQQLLEATINQLRTAGGEGVAALRDIANNKQNPAAGRASAGRALVEMLLRAVETQDITERLERLEGAVTIKGDEE